MTIESIDTVNTTRTQDAQAAGSISPLDVRVLGDSLAGVASPSPKTADYTIALVDRGTCLEMNSSSAHTFFIPTDASVAFDIGTVIEFFRMGTGTVTITAVTPGTTTILVPIGQAATIRVQNTYATIRKRAANIWSLSGDLT